MFSCILINGKIAAATESWWSLHPHEIRILLFLAVTENKDISRDIPVFLPYKSPSVVAYKVAAQSDEGWLLGGLPLHRLQPHCRRASVLLVRLYSSPNGHRAIGHAVLQEFHRYSQGGLPMRP